MDGVWEARQRLSRDYQPQNILEFVSYCHADSDGDCDWSACPQLRDNEPSHQGRHCPLDLKEGDY